MFSDRIEYHGSTCAIGTLSLPVVACLWERSLLLSVVPSWWREQGLTAPLVRTALAHAQESRAARNVGGEGGLFPEIVERTFRDLQEFLPGLSPLAAPAFYVFFWDDERFVAEAGGPLCFVPDVEQHLLRALAGEIQASRAIEVHPFPKEC